MAWGEGTSLDVELERLLLLLTGLLLLLRLEDDAEPSELLAEPEEAESSESSLADSSEDRLLRSVPSPGVTRTEQPLTSSRASSCSVSPLTPSSLLLS